MDPRLPSLLWLCALLFPSFAFNGCTSLPVPPRPSEVRSLESALAALGPEVTPAEARLLARAAYRHPIDLAALYRVVRPASLHNCYVNSGFRARGLCHHWTTDLRAELLTLDLPHLELHWAEARAHTRREHNAIVVTARGRPFDQGVVLDGWRHGGRLVWAPVKADRYPWVEVTPAPEFPVSQPRR